MYRLTRFLSIVCFSYLVWSGADPIAVSYSLFFPLVGVLVVVLSIFLLFRKKIFVFEVTLIFALWLLFVPYTPFVFTYFSTPKNISQSDNGFSVLNFNVHAFTHRGNNYKKRIALSEKIEELIMTYDIDIVCLQEYTSTGRKMYLDTTFLTMYPYYTPEVSSLGSPRIYSKFPILNSEMLFFNNSNGAVAATVLLGKDTVSVINCHLKSHVLTKDLFYDHYFFPKNFDVFRRMNTSNAIINQQLNMILDYTATLKHPVIIAGDMNVLPISYFYKRLKIDFKNSYETSGSGSWTTLNKNGIMSFVQIDHQFYSEGITNYNYKIDQTVNLSDHYPCIGWYRFKK